MEGATVLKVTKCANFITRSLLILCNVSIVVIECSNRQLSITTCTPSLLEILSHSSWGPTWMICLMALISTPIPIATVANINLTLDVDDESSLRICSFIAVVWGAWYWEKSLFSGVVSPLEGKYWSFPSRLSKYLYTYPHHLKGKYMTVVG